MQEQETQGKAKRTVWVGLSTWGPWGREGRGIWGNSALGIRHSMCKSLEAGMCSVCVGRRPVWLELSGQRERVAGAVGEMGRGPPDCAPSGRVGALELGAEAV